MPLPASTLDLVLTTQLAVAFAGEGGEEPRFGWWRTMLVHEYGGLALLQDLAPRTFRSALAPPASPEQLFTALASGMPVIGDVRTGPASQHTIVLRGMSFVATPLGKEVYVLVNDSKWLSA